MTIFREFLEKNTIFNERPVYLTITADIIKHGYGTKARITKRRQRILDVQGYEMLVWYMNLTGS